MRQRAVTIKTSLDRIELTVRAAPERTSGLVFVLPVAAALGVVAWRATGGEVALEAWRDLHPALAVPLAWAGIATVLGAIGALAGLAARAEREAVVSLDASRRAMLTAGTPDDGPRGPAAQYHLGVVQRLDLRWERVARRSWATLGLIPYDVRGATLIAVLAEGARPTLVPFAVEACEDLAEGVREMNYALRSWQVVRERESRQRGEEPVYVAPPDPRATSQSPRDAHHVVVTRRLGVACVWVVLVALVTAAAWPAMAAPPLRRDADLRAWGVAWWQAAFGDRVPLPSFEGPAATAPRTLSMRGDDGSHIEVSVRPAPPSPSPAGSEDGRARHQNGRAAPRGEGDVPAGSGSPEIEIRMGQEVMGRVYPDVLPFEAPLLALLAEEGTAGDVGPVGGGGGDDRTLAIVLRLYEEYRTRLAASRPALAELAALFAHEDVRVATVAVACYGVVGDPASIGALRAFRAELLRTHRGEEERARIAPLVARIDEAEERIRARAWELR